MGIREKPEDLKKAGRLYNLEQEIGELTDLAAQHPEVVERLQALGAAKSAELLANRRPAGRVENPVTLYPTVPRKSRSKKPAKAQAGKKSLDWAKARKGDSYDPSSAPAIANRSFTVSASISGESPSGVIVGHGGSAIGYALYAKAGNAVFAVRYGDQIIRLTRPLKTGSNLIVASLSKDQLSLHVNDGEPAVAKSAGFLKRHPMESLCIGHDDANPLDPSAPQALFTGKIDSASVILQD
jgi:hypothetical protein